MADYIIPEAKLRKQAIRDGITHISTGVAIVHDGKILIVRRVAHDFLGGSFELPGGGVESGETLERAARRETLEETGLIIEQLLGMFPGFDYTTPNKPRVRQYNLLVLVQDVRMLKLSIEHDQYLWVQDESEIDELTATVAMKTCFRDALKALNNRAA